MKPGMIEGHNVKLLAPPNHEDETGETCGALHVRADPCGMTTSFTSSWEAEAEEALWLAAGAALHLQVIGARHPPVRLSVTALPEEFPPVSLVRFVLNAAHAQCVRADVLVSGPLHPVQGWATEPLGPDLAVSAGKAIRRALEAAQEMAKKQS